MLRKHSIIVSAVASVLAAVSAHADGPIPAPIPHGPFQITLQPIASGLVAPIDVRSAPAGSASTLFVTDQAGKEMVIQNGVMQSTPFLDVTSRLAPLSPGYDERGFLGFAFDPNYNNSASDGFHKVYTYTSETVSGPADFTTTPLPAGTSYNNQGVIAQWTVKADGSGVDTSTRKEMIRIDDPQLNHNGGPFGFGPDGNLYIAIGDGGNQNDVGDGHNPITGNAQDLSVPEGKVLRIDPHGTNSANGKYGIPADNPFTSTPGTLKEIYAYGFRNPFRFSWDSANGQLIVADVGQNNVEEVDKVIKGGNYGWHLKEGTFKFNPADGTVSSDLTGLPPGLIDPVAEYDHDEGIAIVGGFVYHGTKLPFLDGKYVFGDFSKSFARPSGRLFYADLNTGAINEFVLGPSDLPLGLFVKGMGEDANGELYVTTTTALGPSGTTGVVFAIVPEPASLGLLSLASLGLLIRRRK